MTIIKLTRLNGIQESDIYVNVDNMDTMMWEANGEHTHIDFGGTDIFVKETPKQIMAKIRRAVGRLIPGDPDDSLEK